MGSPSVKEDWVVEHRLSRLALHPSNSPSWDLAPTHHTQAHTHKLPLFVKTVLAHKVRLYYVKHTAAVVMCDV